MANIVRFNSNVQKNKEYLFKDGTFKDGLNPTGYTLDNNEIKIDSNTAFTMDYSTPKRLIYVKWYRPNGQANNFDSFPILMNIKQTITSIYGYIDFTNLQDIDFVSCISSKEALQVQKSYAANCIKIKEIWIEKVGG